MTLNKSKFHEAVRKKKISARNTLSSSFEFVSKPYHDKILQ